MQGFIEFLSKLRVCFFGRSDLKSGFFNSGTDCFSFLEVKEILGLMNQYSERIQV